MVVVVLGMHRSGTSMTAAVLHALGVRMGTPGGGRLCGRDEFNRWGYWEDHEFRRLNKAILAAAGGDWRRPPSEAAILAAGAGFVDEIRRVVGKKAAEIRGLGDDSVGWIGWGWKDPRTCLTMVVFEPVLREFDADVRYVEVARRRNDIVASLMRRNGGTAGEWAQLYEVYWKRMGVVLAETEGEWVGVSYESMMDAERREWEVERLAAFVGADAGRIEGAMGKIKSK